MKTEDTTGRLPIVWNKFWAWKKNISQAQKVNCLVKITMSDGNVYDTEVM